MAVALITGASGLIGSEAAKVFHERGFEIIGVDNDARSYFFGPQSSTAWKRRELETSLPNYRHFATDVRNTEEIFKIFSNAGKDMSVVIHCAAQPSHDWAAREPFTDFTINANGTLALLEATRQFCPDAVFIFMSTNKVYGDRPNSLPLVELEKRWEIEPSHPYFERGIDESMSIDASMHSLFGVSKTAADLLVQEYASYFGLKTGIFRGGCLTGPAHSGAELHGFLAYLVKCAVDDVPYTVYGYQGKQVRDNIHSSDVVRAFWEFFESPRAGEVYNIGGSRDSSCSIIEAIDMIERLSGYSVQWSATPGARRGDHIWWISDLSKFKKHYPNWRCEYRLQKTLGEMIETAVHARKTRNTTTAI